MRSPADTTELLARLVAIDSVNPALVPGGAGEAEIAAFVARWLSGHGLEVTLDEPLPGRPSVVAVARGSGGGASLMLNAHLDTVTVAGMDRPHEPQVREGRLYGRGAYDMKGGLAAVMIAGATAVADRGRLRGDVVVTAVADEEHASAGVQAVLRRFTADACVVTEPTHLRLVRPRHAGDADGVRVRVEHERRAAARAARDGDHARAPARLVDDRHVQAARLCPAGDEGRDLGLARGARYERGVDRVDRDEVGEQPRGVHRALPRRWTASGPACPAAA